MNSPVSASRRAFISTAASAAAGVWMADGQLAGAQTGATAAGAPAVRGPRDRGPSYRLRRERARHRRPGHPAARVPGRRAGLRWRRAAAGAGRTPRAGAVLARPRRHAISRPARAAHGPAGGDRTGRPRLRRGPEAAAVRGGRLRLGRTCRGDRGRARAGPRARRGADRRLHRPGHGDATPAGLAGNRIPPVVPVGLQHRARPPGSRGEPASVLPPAVASLVAQLAFHRRRIRPHGGLVRQP